MTMMHRMLLWAGLIGVGILCAAPNAALADGIVSDLHISHSIVVEEGEHQGVEAVNIRFHLAEPDVVNLRIERHLAGLGQDAHQPVGRVGQYYYVPEPWPVREIELGRLGAGDHEYLWDGMDEEGNPVFETNVLWYREVRKMEEIPDPPIHDEQVNRFRITVSAGRGETAGNFHRVSTPILASRTVRTFEGAALDSEGNFIIANRRAWRGRRYSPNWRLDLTYPVNPRGHSTPPIHVYDVAVDSENYVYLLGGPGLDRYDPDGYPASWEADEDYIIRVWPIEGVRYRLGVELDPDEEGSYTYNVTADRRRTVDIQEALRRPAFAGSWGGVTIDADDLIYLGETSPSQEIHVFDRSGKFLRNISLPEGLRPETLAIDPEGRLWVADGSRIFRMNRHTGEVQLKPDVRSGKMHLAPDGLIYLYHSTRIWRIDLDGNLVPFTADAPQVTEGGNILDIKPAEGDSSRAAGFARHIFGVAVGLDGRIHIAVGSESHAYRSSDHRLLTFTPDGRFLPDNISAELEQHRPGNLFLDNEPAVVEVFINNLAEEAELNADWTLTDFYGSERRGTTPMTARAAARQRLPLEVPVEDWGHYTLHVTLRDGDTVLEEMETQLARIRSSELGSNPDSHFGMCWGLNYYMMAHAGAQMQRVSEGLWDKVEPQGGYDLSPYYNPEAIQWSKALDGHRAYAGRWGIQLPGRFVYGEPWVTEGAINHRIYHYDRFYKYMLRVIDDLGGVDDEVSHYQFWNEPNFFWHDSMEHFSLATKHAWCIVKARQKDTISISDGDTGTLRAMEALVRDGANMFNDGIQIHYPASQSIEFDDISFDRYQVPESKMGMMQDTVALRDSGFPGKQIWNTEDGWWGAPVKSPEVGAKVIPRTYLPQISIGVDKVFWFEGGRGQDDPTYLLGPQNLPYPSYVSYATMTRHLEGADYLGRLDMDAERVWVLAFQHPDGHAVLAAWVVNGTKQVNLNAGVERAISYDLMDRPDEIIADDGVLPVELTEHVQYIHLPRNEFILGITRSEIQRRLAGAPFDVNAPFTFTERVVANARDAATDLEVMNRLYHDIMLLRHRVLAGQALPQPDGDLLTVADVRGMITGLEGDDGYLRQARVALDWTERLDRASERHGGELGNALKVAQHYAGQAAVTIARHEEPLFPGVAINAYLETSEIRANTASDERLDKQFEFEIERAPGNSFELELTVWNYYRHTISGVLLPRLPDGWTSEPSKASYEVAPGDYQRFFFRVTIPDDADEGVHQIGALTSYKDSEVQEIHAVRVNVDR